jgi:hypothetical protein
MGRFYFDGFSDAAGVALTAHAPFGGGAYQKVTGSTDIVISNANRARGTGNGVCLCINTALPDSADYDVAGAVFRQTGVGGWWAALRASQAANTCYAVGYTGSGWQVLRIVNGASTQLATFAQAWANNEQKQFRVKIRGTNPVNIRVLDAIRGGAEIINVNDANAARITAAGFVGIRLDGGTNSLLNQRGYHIARLNAAALPADPRPRAARPGDGVLGARIIAKLKGEERNEEKARVMHEGGAPPEWQHVHDGVTYTISLPQGVQLRPGGNGRLLLFVPQIACDPPPPVHPLEPTGYQWPNPPLRVFNGTVREELDNDGEPYLVENSEENRQEAFRQMVESVLFDPRGESQ